jgi:hypothetical protein
LIVLFQQATLRPADRSFVLAHSPLRGEEVCGLFTYLASGGAVFPMSILQPEGMPYQVDQ